MINIFTRKEFTTIPNNDRIDEAVDKLLDKYDYDSIEVILQEPYLNLLDTVKKTIETGEIVENEVSSKLYKNKEILFEKYSESIFNVACRFNSKMFVFFFLFLDCKGFTRQMQYFCYNSFKNNDNPVFMEYYEMMRPLLKYEFN